MLRPERMMHVQLLARREDKPTLIRILAAAKLLHLIDHKKETVSNTEIDIGSPLEGADHISEALTKARNLLSKLPADETPVSAPQSSDECIAKIEEIAREFAHHEDAYVAATRELEEIGQKRALLTPLGDFDEPIEALFSSKRVEAILARPTGAHNDAMIKKLKPLEQLQTKTDVLLIVRSEQAEHTRASLRAEGYQLIDLAPLRSLTGKITQIETDFAQREERAKKTVHAHAAFVKKFAHHVPLLHACEQALTLELMKAQAPLHFGTTRKAVLVRGFVPERRANEFRKRIEAAQIPIVLDITPSHDGPVELRNPPQMRNFEDLIELYTLPKYDEIDPTSLMAITFPIFFGFMLGDMGYGLALLILFSYLRYAMPKARKLCDIVILSAISSIIFGYVFGEVFGLEHIFGYEFHPLIHRVHEINEMFMIAIAMGAVHLNLGLVLGIINESHHYGWLLAFVKKGSWIVFQAGVVLVAAAKGLLHEVPLLNAIHVSPLVGWIVLGLGIAGILYGEKMQGLFELPSIFGNLLSYLRLVAIGLSSVYIALIVNDLGGGLFAKGGIWLVIGLFIIIFGHTLNLALGLLGPFMHSLRLHYAEFFMKFYAGGGKKYQPFGVVHE